jgi:amino acid adenylation domain-containing protein
VNPAEGYQPLAPAQRRFWFAHQLVPDGTPGNQSIGLALRGPLDLEAMRGAARSLVARHPMLRATYHEVDGEPVFRVHQGEETFRFSQTDLSDCSESEVRTHVRAQVSQRWDLGRLPCARWELIARGPTEHLLVLYLPHLSMDGYSYLRLIPEELLAFYAGRGDSLPELESDYAEFARRQGEQVRSGALQASVDWWAARLDGSPAALELPTDRRRPPLVEPDARRTRRLLAPELRDALSELARAQGATLADVLFAAWNVFLGRYSGAEDVVVGTPLANRRPPFLRVFGCLMNPIAIRTDLTGDPSFVELLSRVGANKAAAYPHREAPLDAVLEAVTAGRRADPSRAPVYQVMFNFMNFTVARAEEAGLELEVRRLEVPAVVDLTLHVEERSQGLFLMLEWASALFLPESVERMLAHLERLLAAAVEDPQQRISRLPLLGDEERRRVLFEWNDTSGPYPDDILLHQSFEAQASAQPDRAALLFGEQVVSYGELEQRANRLAAYLRQQGVGADDLVGVCVDRSPDLIVALLGVLKAGGAYVPLDPEFPPERLRFMLDDTEAPLVITQAAFLERLPSDRRAVVLDGADEAAIAAAGGDPLPPLSRPDQRAYVIYTSGSTGRPKGVVVRHQPAQNLIDWVNQTFSVGADDTLLFVTSPCFDLSVYDVFGTLAAGGRVRIASSDELRNPDALVRYLVDGEVTFWDSAPAALGQVAPFFPGRAPSSSLRLVFLSGDWIPVPLPDRVRAVFREAQVISLGGATEATVWSNYFPVGQVDPAWKSIPYGRPIRNARYYVLDRHLQPAPIGVPGELFIGGPCLASGYHRRPELNAERFLEDPFVDAGGKLYRTGDMARFLDGGDIEFLGRVDHQVKVRGYRIELGEIEAALDRHPGVERSVVLAPADASGERVLVAYVVPQEGAALEVDALLGYLGERLPRYMVPLHLVPLEAIPLTANGKVDRQALPAPTRQAGTYTAPRDPTEAALAGICAQVLSLDRVGVHDDFFELGGTSIRAVRVLAEVRSRFDCRLPLVDFYRYPTVAGLAEALEREGALNEELLVVEIQEGDGRPPLWLIHPVGGHVVFGHRLAAYLDPGQPVLGIQAQGLDGRRSPHEDMGEMAAHYLRLIRDRQPEGPYYLAGPSLGGEVAYEIARRLTAMDQRVALVAMFDTYAPGFPAHKRLSGRISDHLRKFRKLDWSERADYVRQRVAWRLHGREHGFKPYELEAGDADEVVGDVMRVVRANQRASAAFAVLPWEGRVQVFRARDIPDWPGLDYSDETNGWRRFARGGVDVFRVEGNHRFMMDEPAVSDAGRQLRECLEAARAREARR